MTGRLTETLQRVRLRPLREPDLGAFLVYRSDPEVAKLQGWEPMSSQEAAQVLAEGASATYFAAGKWTQIGIADLSTDHLIGDLGVYLSPAQDTAEFGVTVTPSAQGHSYASEAVRGLIQLLFSTTPVAQVIACTDVRNAPCIAALKRAGMELIETRQAEYKGEACLEHLFSVQRPEG